MPVSHTAYKFVRDPPEWTKAAPDSGEQRQSPGKVVLMAGLPVTTGGPEGAYAGYAGDKAFTWALARRYDVVASWGSTNVALEGSVALLDGERLRLRLVHGVSGALVFRYTRASLTDPTVVAAPGAGLLFEYAHSDHGVLYAMGKYAWRGTVRQGAERVRPHSFTVSVGHGFGWEILRIAPELAVTQLREADLFGTKPQWVFEPMLLAGGAF